MNQTRLLQKVIDKHLCLGCGLCTIQGDSPMTNSSRGFPVPRFPEKCDKDFSQYCPAIYLRQNVAKRGGERIWGPFPHGIKVSHATDKDVNFKASSGGTITALLLYLWDNHQIDGVLEVKGSTGSPCSSEGYFATSREAILECMGSRYAPCSLFENFDGILSENHRIAVVGKPCDIAGLRQYLRHYPEYASRVKYCFSMMCMGLPSSHATEELVHFLGASPEQVRELRYRGHGWPGRATVTQHNQTQTSCSYIESWGAILGRNTLFRCKICPDGLGEFADVSCGDAWYCKNGEPCFDNEDRGRSFAIARNDHGHQLLQAAEAAGYVVLGDYDTAELPLIQKAQYQRKLHVGLRYFMFKILICRQIKFRGFYFLDLLCRSSIREIYRDWRGFVGRYWRDYLGRKKNG